jgi:hypothetical protein
MKLTTKQYAKDIQRTIIDIRKTNREIFKLSRATREMNRGKARKDRTPNILEKRQLGAKISNLRAKKNSLNKAIRANRYSIANIYNGAKSVVQKQQKLRQAKKYFSLGTYVLTLHMFFLKKRYLLLKFTISKKNNILLKCSTVFKTKTVESKGRHKLQFVKKKPITVIRSSQKILPHQCVDNYFNTKLDFNPTKTYLPEYLKYKFPEYLPIFKCLSNTNPYMNSFAVLCQIALYILVFSHQEEIIKNREKKNQQILLRKQQTKREKRQRRKQRKLAKKLQDTAPTSVEKNGNNSSNKNLTTREGQSNRQDNSTPRSKSTIKKRISLFRRLVEAYPEIKILKGGKECKKNKKKLLKKKKHKVSNSKTNALRRAESKQINKSVLTSQSLDLRTPKKKKQKKLRINKKSQKLEKIKTAITKLKRKN